jgi:hypothetical protein
MKKRTNTESALEPDNGGRRLGAERRNFSYTYYIPERRNGQDRRKGEDRRMSLRPKISFKSRTPRGDDQLDQTGIPS